jgi:hypothetical protein
MNGMVEETKRSEASFEREKWRTDIELKRQELSIKEQEQKRLAREAERSRWWNPLFIAIVGATIAALGNIGVSWWNGRVSEQTETLKAESARIVEMIHATDIKTVRENLRFLLESGLITGATAANVKNYLAQTPADQGPLLVGLSWVQPSSPQTEASVISAYVCPGGNPENQYWIYRYTARRPDDPTFRVIRPPNWGQAIGGHDLFTRQDAEKVALDACNSQK